jgi:broad specificity polyphosphatase/5'/3'-nucleotidase SurE
MEAVMDVSGIASMATSLAETQSSQNVGISVLKKALDAERDGAAALLNAIPPPSSVNLPAHLGQNINTTA